MSPQARLPPFLQAVLDLGRIRGVQPRPAIASYGSLAGYAESRQKEPPSLYGAPSLSIMGHMPVMSAAYPSVVWHSRMAPVDMSMMPCSLIQPRSVCVRPCRMPNRLTNLLPE